MLLTTASAVLRSSPVAFLARSTITAYSAGWAIIIARFPAMNGSWFSTCVLVRAEIGTDLSRTYMS